MVEKRKHQFLDRVMQYQIKFFAGLFFLILFSGKISEAKNEISPSDLVKAKFKESDYVKRLERSSQDLNSGPVDEYCEALCKRIYGNWEVADDRSMRFRVHMFIDKNGRFSNITIKSDLANEQDLFSCYEAVSSVSGFRKSVPAGISEVELLLNSDEATMADYFAKFVRENASQSGKIVWHRIPLETLQCNGRFKRSLVQSVDNLKCGSKADFEKIKISWLKFLRGYTCPTERQILQYANSLDKEQFQ